jgi:DNA-binding NtrC family response regulator
VVLLSCTLPGFSPEDAVDLLQARAPHIPVVLTVDRGSMDFPFALLENGACDFVFKSNPARLLAVIERECTKIQLSDEAQQALVSPDNVDRIDEGVARFSSWRAISPSVTGWWMSSHGASRTSVKVTNRYGDATSRRFMLTARTG